MEEKGLAKCKTCGKEFSTNQVMTYSVYGYCSWDCLMNQGVKRNNNSTRDYKDNRRKNNGHRYNHSPRYRSA